MEENEKTDPFVRKKGRRPMTQNKLSLNMESCRLRPSIWKKRFWGHDAGKGRCYGSD
jgi:hypothetical protein